MKQVNTADKTKPEYRFFIKYGRMLIPVTGFLALIWFLIRVIPKPSRAFYPCQRAAFPLAASFLIWLSAFMGSVYSVKKIKSYYTQDNYWRTVVFVILAFLSLLLVPFSGPLFLSAENTGSPISYLPLITDDLTGAVMPRAVVAIVRSDKSRAVDITANDIEQMVRQAAEMAGGWDDLIHDHDVVVIKPNLVNPSQEGHSEPLRREVNGVTTDYRVIQAVVNMVRERNPNGKILVMEGSAFGKTAENMEKLGWLGITGVDQFIGIEDSSGAMRDYTSAKLVKRSLTPGRNLYKAANNIYYLNKIYHNADVLISIPVMKTHGTAAFTGGIKNLGIGGTPANIYGDETGETNLRWPFLDHTSSYDTPLHDWIHDYYLCRPADFVIMDALTGLEYGPGIAAGTDPDKVRKNTRCIMAGKDAVALDAIAALAVQVDPAKVKYLVTLHNDNAGCADTRYIRVKGVPLDQIKGSFRNSATYAAYYDNTAPVVSVQSYQLSADTLYLSLRAESQMKKIEVSLNDTMLDPIYTAGFNDLRISLGRSGVQPAQVRLYAYDPYLNCTTLSLASVSLVPGMMAPDPEIKIYPNPFVSQIILDASGLSSASVQITISNLSGKEIGYYSFTTEHYSIHQMIDLGDLPEGIYVITMRDGWRTTRQKIVKK
jgi:uncharacterized protein (DUF362 family)